MVAEGSFANREVMTENGMHNGMQFICVIMHFGFLVHLRKRKSEHGKLRPPSTSAITYWQIEKVNEPLNGIVKMHA